MAGEHRRWVRQGEAFWRAHHDGWKRSDLNQRQYCEAQGLPQKAFENWRQKFRTEPQPPERKLLYRRLALAACWAHARRKFYDVHEATRSPIAAEALRRIAGLYAIEKTFRGRTADERRAVRQADSRPLIAAMKPWLEKELGRISGRGGLAEAIRYALTRWPALSRFLDDGRIDLDNNPVERAIRPVALGRKNHLFAGSDGGGARWATVCSLVTTVKLNDVEPFAYLQDILERTTEGHPMSRLDELLL